MRTDFETRGRPAAAWAASAAPLLLVTFLSASWGPARPVPAVESDARLGSGKLLVASPELQDPNFARTVVLLVHFDDRGALGLVVNRPTKVRLASVLPGIEDLARREDTVFIGGPVSQEEVHVLASSEKPLEGALHVFDGVYATRSRELLERLAREGPSRRRFRVYTGYAGWGPGQLDAEVARGDWQILPAHEQEVFAPRPSGLWRSLVVSDPRLLAEGDGRAGGPWLRRG